MSPTTPTTLRVIGRSDSGLSAGGAIRTDCPTAPADGHSRDARVRLTSATGSDPIQIASGERAAFMDRDPQQTEVVRADADEASAGRERRAGCDGSDVTGLALLQWPRVGEGHTLDVRELVGARGDTFVERTAGSIVRRGALAEGESPDPDIGDVEAHVDAQHADRALDSEAGAHQQGQARRHLRGDQDRTRPALHRPFSGALLPAGQGKRYRCSPGDPDWDQRADRNRQHARRQVRPTSPDRS